MKFAGSSRIFRSHKLEDGLKILGSGDLKRAIGDLGDKAKPIAEQLKALPAKGESPDGRFSGYVARLLADLNGGRPAFEDAGEPQPKKKKKGKKAAKQKDVSADAAPKPSKAVDEVKPAKTKRKKR